MWEREALPHDLYDLAHTMRAADAAEIFMMQPETSRDAFAARLYRMLPYALFARVYGLDSDSRAIVFLGIWSTHDSNALAQAALFATDEFPRLAGDFVRHMRRFVVPAQLANGVRRVECRTLATYSASRRLLRALGAIEEGLLPDVGPAGEAFVQCAWRRSDWIWRGRYVLRLNTERTGDARSQRSG